MISRKFEDLTIYNNSKSNNTFSNPIIRLAKGIVFDSNGNMISMPYNKFFNYGENKETADVVSDMISNNMSMRVAEKLDGTLIHTFLHNGCVRVATRGVIEENEFCQKVRECYMPSIEHCDRYVYIWELIDPISKVLVPYTDYGLYLTGIFDKESNSHLSIPRVIEFAKENNLKHAKYIDAVTDFDKVKEYIDSIEFNEGVVVSFEDEDFAYYKVKIKSSQYLTALKAMYSYNPDSVEDAYKMFGKKIYFDKWESVDDDWDEFFNKMLSSYVPEEIVMQYKDTFYKMYEIAAKESSLTNDVICYVDNCVKYTKKKFDRKQFAKDLMDAFPRKFAHIGFSYLDGKKWEVDIV